MDCVRKQNKFVLHFLPFLVLFAIFGFLLCPVRAYATTGDEEVETVGDMYDVSTALTAYVNNVVGANSNDKHNNQRVENPGNVGNAGGYVGYGDEKNQDFVSFITSTTTNGASASTYDAWENIIDGGNANAAYFYTRFGRTLADAGLDETVDGSSGLDGWRVISGVISMIFYTASQLVPVIFGLMLKLLKTLNVFALFGQATVGWSAYWKSAFPAGHAVLDPLVKFVSGTYSSIMTNLTWKVIVPLMVAFMAFSILLLKKKAQTQIANFVKRLTFIAIGVPICAGLYTAALNQMEKVTLENTPTSQLVAASFVDFESWANSRLNVHSAIQGKIESAPKGTDGAVNDGGTASTKMLKNLRVTALEINKKYSKGIPHGWTISSNAHANLSGSQWDRDGERNTSGATVSFDAQQSLYNIMNRYMKKETYSASAWSTYVAKQLNSRGANAMGNAGTEDDTTIRAMFDTTDEVSDWMRREQPDNQAIWKGQTAPSDTSIGWTRKTKYGTDTNGTIFNNGTMKTIPSSATNTSKVRWKGKLSDLSMYNYLSTSFGESSIVTYSNVNSVSEHTQKAHASVTMTGNGVLGILFGLNMWVTIGITSVIGCYFAISMAFKNIKTGVKLLTSVPMAVLGVVKSIAQVIIYVIMMIAQLFIGAFMYSFVSELLCVFASIVERLVANATGYTDGSTPDVVTILFGGRAGSLGMNMDQNVLFNSTVGVYLMVAFEIVLVLFAGYSLWKYRRAACRVYSYSWYKVYQFVTFAEFQDELERIWNGGQRVKQPGLTPVPVYACHSFVSEILLFLKPVDREEVLV